MRALIKLLLILLLAIPAAAPACAPEPAPQPAHAMHHAPEEPKPEHHGRSDGLIHGCIGCAAPQRATADTPERISFASADPVVPPARVLHGRAALPETPPPRLI